MTKRTSAGSIRYLEKHTLKRNLGILDLFAVGYGDLGSSIYYALGITAFFALGAAPVSLMLAGLVFICTALTYAEMVSISKDTGGSASFARLVFNDLISFIAGWGLLLDYIVTIAISIFAVGSYLTFFHEALKTTSVHLGLSIGLIIILFLINFRGVKHSTQVSIWLTGFTLVTQFVIVFIALFSAKDLLETFKHMQIGAGTSWSPSWTDFFKGTAMAMVAYTGIESIAVLGSETRTPAKTLPRAMVLVMFVLIATYLGVSIVALAMMTPQELGHKYLEDPIAGIVAHLSFGSTFLGPWIGLLAASILFVAGNAGLMGASRLSFNMGEYYQLPRFFYRIHEKFRTPYLSLAIFAALACLILLWSRGKLDFLADLYNFGAMIAFFSAHLSLIVLRCKKPNLKAPFRSPLNIPFGRGVCVPLTALVGSVATLAVLVTVIITKPEGRNLGCAWMVLGLGMYLLYRKRKKIGATAQVQIKKIKVPQYKPAEIGSVLVLINRAFDTTTVQVACELAKFHKAPLTAVYFVEVPFSIPLESQLPYKGGIGEVLLEQVEAVSRDFNIPFSAELMRARFVEEGIVHLVKERGFDLLVMAAVKSKKSNQHRVLRDETERILKSCPCRVVIATS